jgi:hypothetical protein
MTHDTPLATPYPHLKNKTEREPPKRNAKAAELKKQARVFPASLPPAKRERNSNKASVRAPMASRERALVVKGKTRGQRLDEVNTLMQEILPTDSFERVRAHQALNPVRWQHWRCRTTDMVVVIDWLHALMHDAKAARGGMTGLTFLPDSVGDCSRSHWEYEVSFWTKHRTGFRSWAEGLENGRGAMILDTLHRVDHSQERETVKRRRQGR